MISKFLQIIWSHISNVTLVHNVFWQKYESNLTIDKIQCQAKPCQSQKFHLSINWSKYNINLVFDSDQELNKKHGMWCHGVVIITTVQLQSTNLKSAFYTASNPACNMSEVKNGEDLTMILVRYTTEQLSLVNHSTKTICYHHQSFLYLLSVIYILVTTETDSQLWFEVTATGFNPTTT